MKTILYKFGLLVASLTLSGCGGVTSVEPPTLRVDVTEPQESILDDLKGTSPNTSGGSAPGESILDDLRPSNNNLRVIPKTPLSQPLNYGGTVNVIFYQNSRIPVDQIHIGVGPECNQEQHWHANNGAGVYGYSMDAPYAKIYLPDPGGCGYGTLKQRPVFSVEGELIPEDNLELPKPKVGF